MEMMDCNNFL